MKLVVGLGNPGAKYENTRHNIGFMFLDYLAEQYSAKFTRKNNYELAEININGEKVFLLKPQTFMNLSGEAVKQVLSFYKLTNDDLIVIYDDLDMEFGKLRAKYNSSAGGHNGIKNIIAHLHTQEFMRIKFGISNEHKRDVKSFVLSNFSKQEMSELNQMFDKILSATTTFIEGRSLEEIQTKLLN